MSQKSLVIDGNSYMWRAFYAYGLLNNGVSNGIIKYVFDVVKKFSPSSVVICWDHGKSLWRSELYPSYKSNRIRKKEDIDMEELSRQANLSKKFLLEYNISSISVRGVEADDLISWVSEYISRFNHKQVVIITSDKDIWQLVNDDRIVFDHVKEKIVDKKYIVDEMNISSDKIIEVKAMMGDKSDNVVGINGIGEKTAIKLINDYGSLKQMLEISNVGNLSSSKRTVKILDDYDELNISYKLMKIPSLDEALYYLNDEQYDMLCEVANISVVDKSLENNRCRMKLHMYRDSMDSSLFPSKEEVSFLSLEDVTGMLVAMGKKEEEEYTSLGSLDNAIRSCEKCKNLGNNVGYNPTLPSGYDDVDIMIITDHPDEDGGLFDEDSHCGKVFDGFLNEVGLTRRECWITSVNKCHPVKTGIITKSEMNSCMSYLKSEIKLLKPKFIIVMGNEAMSVVTPYKFGINKHCGEILEIKDLFMKDLNVKVAVCVNPFNVIRSVRSKSEMKFAILKIKEFLDSVE